MTAVSSTYDGCRMMGVTAAIRSADGRRTINLTTETKRQNNENIVAKRQRQRKNTT
ncbi:MAG: hypothetical protein HXL36_04940 [Prevotellaceae bacterium]|nr:hypothetical protein [Prevotellaceae bacterium]